MYKAVYMKIKTTGRNIIKELIIIFVLFIFSKSNSFEYLDNFFALFQTNIPPKITKKEAFV